ncbi:MAG: XTP/dITP diphosphatase [Desulfovibrionaceae bacterium]|jgi:XTP/dITP diphosphohydrolase|nr:XTP/dITP diphosphatase [Desulfovibrionaceae bacterium]
MNPTSPTVVLATRNKGKIAELTALLAAHSITVLGLDAFPEIGEIEETGATFAENSAIKARAVCEATGMVAVADDSGLEVDALDGAPGVRSARYSGEDATDARNNAKLLEALDGVPEARRTARFRCVMTAAAPGGELLVADGAWEGRVALAPAGGNGFGYDPLFFDPELGRTAAELDKAAKNARSHRGRALERLLASWPEFWDRVCGG